MTLGGKTEFLQGFRIQLQHDRVGLGDEAHAGRPLQVVAIAHLVVTRRFGNRRVPETAVLDVALQLLRIRRALALRFAVLAAPAGQQADAGRAFVAQDVVGVVAELRRTVFVGHRRQAEARAKIEQYRLEAAHIPIRREDRMPDRIAGAIGIGNRTIEQGDRVEAFEVGRVGQDQVGIGDHLARIRVRVDDLGDAVLAVLALVGQPAHRIGGVHRRVPAHVRHEHEEHVHRFRIGGPGVADDRMQHPVHGQRIAPGVGVIDAARLALRIDQQVLRPVHETQRRRVEATVGATRFAGTVRWRNRARERRLVTERTRRIHRAEQQLQYVQGATGVEAVAMRADAAHRMHRHRARTHRLVPSSVRIGPGDRQFERLVEGGFGQFARDAADGVRRNAAAFGNGIRRVLRIEIALGEQMEDRQRLAAVGQRHFADHGRRNVGSVGGRTGSLPCSQGRVGVGWIVLHDNPLPASPLQGRGRSNSAQRAAFCITKKQSIVGATRIADHQPMRIGVAHQVIEIDAIGLQQFVDQGEGKQAVGTRADADPLVGDGAVTAADRIDRDDLRAAALQLAEAELDRIGIVVFGHAPHHQVARVLPVGFAEFPETAAQRVQAAGRHVHRAEAAVRGVVDRAVLLRPPAGQGLRLVAAGEEGEAVGIAFARLAQPLRGQRQRLVPFDFAELVAAAFARAQHRLAQARRRVVLHDAGRAFRAKHAAVDRMVRIAFDVADLAVAQMHVDAATAGAHVAGGLLDLGADGFVQIERGFGHPPILPARHPSGEPRGPTSADRSGSRRC